MSTTCPLRVVGVLSRKGADINSEDQDDLLVALDDGQVSVSRGSNLVRAKRKTRPRRISTALQVFSCATLPAPACRSVSDHRCDAVDRQPSG